MEMMTLPTAEAAREARAFIKKAGGNTTLDRLAEFLAYELDRQEIFVINRSFSAQRQRLSERPLHNQAGHQA